MAVCTLSLLQEKLAQGCWLKAQAAKGCQFIQTQIMQNVRTNMFQHSLAMG